jgi:hypothetical protein
MVERNVPALGRMVSAMVGQKILKDVGHDATGPAGALVGVTLSLIARRLGPFGMAGAVVGLWAMHEVQKARRNGVAASRRPMTAGGSLPEKPASNNIPES